MRDITLIFNEHGTFNCNRFWGYKIRNIEIKKYNFFIGHTSSGKVLLQNFLQYLTIDFLTIKEGDFNSFLRLLDKYNINFEFTSTTIIRYSNEKYYWEIGLNKFHSNYEDADLMEMANTSKSYDFILKFIERKENNFAYKEFIKSLKNLLDLKDSAMVELIKPALVGLLYEECIPVYIPAERLLISTFSNSIFSLLQAGASIPDCIKDFGSLYEKARIQYKNIDINILDIKVSFNNNGDTVYLMNENKEVKLSQTSSGIQSIIPLWIVFNQYVESKKNRY